MPVATTTTKKQNIIIAHIMFSGLLNITPLIIRHITNMPNNANTPYLAKYANIFTPMFLFMIINLLRLQIY